MPSPAASTRPALVTRVSTRSTLLLRASLLAMVVATPALVQPAFAQSAGQWNDTPGAIADQIDLPDVVVSATLSPLPEREVASSVTVITGKDMEERQQPSVPEALEAVPGLNVVQTGGPGGTTSVFIRGTNSNHVKVMLDGIELSDPSTPGGTFDFGYLFTNDLARMEVLRGPQSGLYGSDAIGGVISMNTERGEGPAKALAYIEGGALGTFNQVASLKGSLERFSYNFNVGHYASSAIPVTPPAIVPFGTPNNDNSNDNLTLSARLDADLSDVFSVNLTGRYIDATLDYTSDLFNSTTYMSEPAPYQDSTASRTFIGKAEGLWKALDDKLLSTFGIAATTYNRDNASVYKNNRSTYDGDRQTYYWRSNYNFMPGQNLLVGLEHKQENMETTSAWTKMKANRNDSAGYAQLQSSAWERLFVAANIRYDDYEDFGGQTTWRIAPALLIPETNTKLKVTYGTGFKAPTLFQLYSPSSGNPNLKPEESKGWDAGFEQTLWEDKIGFGVTYFHNDIDNLIITSRNMITGNWTNENITNAKTQGVEAFVSYRLNDQFSVRADFTRTNTVGYFPAGGSFGASCAQRTSTSCYPVRRPNNKASLAINWQPVDPLVLTATIVHLTDWWDIDRVSSTIVRQPGYTIVNLSANYSYNENLTVFGRVDNLLDETYQDPNGWLAPGFGAYAGLRLTY